MSTYQQCFAFVRKNSVVVVKIIILDHWSRNFDIMYDGEGDLALQYSLLLEMSLAAIPALQRGRLPDL